MSEVCTCGFMADAETAKNVAVAQNAAKSKLLQRTRNSLREIVDEMKDEGDRVYLGSTNHADTLRALIEEMEGWAWKKIMHGVERDPYADLRELKRAILGGEPDPAVNLTLGNYLEMAAHLHAGIAGGLARIAQLEAEAKRAGEVLTAYRAATSWIAADSWDGCSDCMDHLKAAACFDGLRDPMTSDELANALAMIRPFKPSCHVAENPKAAGSI